MGNEIQAPSANIATHIAHTPNLVGTGTAPAQGATNKWAVLAIAAASGFMTTLDSSIVNISLPTIARSFGIPLNGTIEWVIIGYLVIIAAVLLTFGRLADMFGRKPILLAGLVIFTIGSAICGAAPSLGVLVASRMFQGIGAALIFAVNVALITGAFPASQRGQALGLNSVVTALGISIGPTIGGILTQQLSWRWIFFVNIPIGILVLLAALRSIPASKQRVQEHFDPVGAVLLAIGFAGLTLGLSFGQEWGWTSPGLLSSLGIGVVALIVAILVERRTANPILSLTLLENRVFSSATISFILAMLALFAPGFLLPFYFEQLRGFSTQQSGLLLTPLPITLAIIAPLSGRLSDQFGSRWLAPLGLAIACLGLFLLSQLNVQSSIWDIVWRLVVIGLGQGLFISPNTSTLMGAASASEQGEASGVFATGRVLGQSISVAVGGAVFTTLGAATAGPILAAQAHTLSASQLTSLQNTFVTGFRAALLACAAFAVLGIFTALVRGSSTAKALTSKPIAAQISHE